MFKRFGLALMCLLSANTAFSQEGNLSSVKGKSYLGVGLGLTYGAVGLRFSTNVADRFSLFGGVGYMISGLGYNVGLQKVFKSSSLTEFYLSAMYGTNAAIKVSGLSEYDEVYLGPSFGMGLKLNSRRKEGNFWDLGVIVPIRSSDFENDFDLVKEDPRITSITEPWPVLINVGYNFRL